MVITILDITAIAPPFFIRREIAASELVPTLLYPNGGETFNGSSINIRWEEPLGLSSSTLMWYEIFITDVFDKNKKPELLQIATVPYGNSSYNYYIQENLKGKKCRIGIRYVTHSGIRSEISFSADNFIIVNKELPSPALMEPVTGDTYFSYVPFIFDYESILGRASQRSFYQIYYKSDNQNIDWTLLKKNIMIGSDPINIDVSYFNTDSDYVFKIELVDGDNVSPPVFIDNIKINNVNLFVIDTVPPDGTIKIVDNDEYTKETTLLLELSANDKDSGVKDFQIQQTNVGETDDNKAIFKGPFVSFSSIVTWDIVGENGGTPIDGVKLIQSRYRDYGDNVIEDSESANFFRTYKNIENREVSTFLYDNNYLYTAFVGDDISGDLPQLYKDLTLLSTLQGEATALKVYNNILYIAIKDDEEKGILQRLSGGTVNTVINNNSQYLDSSQTILNSLFLADSIINVMEVFDNTLFLGLNNGELLSFKGSIIETENDDYLNVKSINNIKTDGNILYIFFENSTEILTMYKDTSGNYIFSLVNTEN
jgi:hypothetical protein